MRPRSRSGTETDVIWRTDPGLDSFIRQLGGWTYLAFCKVTVLMTLPQILTR